jgi:Family of unknown function (DUF5662)
MTYDSRPDTWKHIFEVQQRIRQVVVNLNRRAEAHDHSKLINPEKPIWDIVTPKLATIKYPSEEYNTVLREMGPALDHHYEANDHHPEHFENGMAGMSLMGMIEMLCDWKAATERTPGSDFGSLFDKHKKRWGYSDDVDSILRNTAKELGFV